MALFGGSKSSTTNYTEANTTTTTKTNTNAIEGAGNYVINADGMSRITMTDGGAVAAALGAMEANSGLVANTIGAFGASALDSMAGVNQDSLDFAKDTLRGNESLLNKALGFASDTTTSSNRVVSDALDQSHKTANNAIVGILENTEHTTNTIGSLFDKALDWSSNTMHQAAVNARSESGQILTEGQAQVADNMRLIVMVGGALVGVAAILLLKKGK